MSSTNDNMLDDMLVTDVMHQTPNIDMEVKVGVMPKCTYDNGLLHYIFDQ